VISLLKSKWTASALGSVFFVLVVALSWRTPTIHPVAAAPLAFSQAGPSWSFFNPELEQLITELNKEKAALAARESQLKQWESRLQTERQEINSITQAVHQLQQEFDKNVVRVRDEESPNLKRLARTYTAMEPESAVAIFRQMEDPTLVKILLCMKDTDTAPILAALAKTGEADAKRTAALSERLRQSVPANPTAKSAAR
jgi:flagellar motility protein MotE (MotC chaperone)